MTSEMEKKNAKDLEYEFLYIVKDQTMLYLDMSQSNLGYADNVLARVNEMVDKLGHELHREDDA